MRTLICVEGGIARAAIRYGAAQVFKQNIAIVHEVNIGRRREAIAKRGEVCVIACSACLVVIASVEFFYTPGLLGLDDDPG